MTGKEIIVRKMMVPWDERYSLSIRFAIDPESDSLFIRSACIRDGSVQEEFGCKVYICNRGSFNLEDKDSYKIVEGIK